jgi:hypothetical protein
MEPTDIDTTFDIMVSPQFYTYKHEDLAVRFLYQARKLAPSILENLLPSNGKYEYYVFREEDGWAFIAYDHEMVSHFLQERGIPTDKIAKLYFAQQVAEKFTVPVLLNENEVLGKVQNTATVLPRALLSTETKYQAFSDTFRPSGGKTFGAGSRSIINEKNTWILSAVFFAFGLMFAVEGMRYRNVIETMQGKVALLLKDYPALQSAYSRENIARKYRKIDKEERHKREVLKGLSRLMLPGVQLESLLLDGKRFAAALKCPDEKTVVRVQSLAKERQYKSSRAGSENLLKIEGSL